MRYILFFVILNGMILFAQDDKKNPSLEESVFRITDGKVFLKDHLIPNADASSFKILNAICHGDEDKHCFGADKNRVYYYSQELPSSDSMTFRFLGNGYSADKKNVYYIMDNVFKHIKEADGKSFQVLGSPVWAESSYAYARDNKFAYYDGVKLKGSDGSSFTLISKKGKYHARDKSNYYINSESLPIKVKKKK